MTSSQPRGRRPADRRPADSRPADSQPADGQPLARLFAIAYRLLIDGLHERLRARGWTDVRPAFGFVLLGTVLLVGALCFLPALALGPVAEHLGPIPFGR